MNVSIELDGVSEEDAESLRQSLDNFRIGWNADDARLTVREDTETVK